MNSVSKDASLRTCSELNVTIDAIDAVTNCCRALFGGTDLRFPPVLLVRMNAINKMQKKKGEGGCAYSVPVVAMDEPSSDEDLVALRWRKLQRKKKKKKNQWLSCCSFYQVAFLRQLADQKEGGRKDLLDMVGGEIGPLDEGQEADGERVRIRVARCQGTADGGEQDVLHGR